MNEPRLLSARELYDAEDAERQANAEELWLARMRDNMANGPQVNLAQGIYTVSVTDAQLDFDLLTTDRRTGETHAELTIYLTDAVNLGKLIHKGRLNLLSGDRRERLARYLAARTKELDIDWADVLEQASTAVLGLYRAGEPAILLRDAPEPPGAGEPLIAPVLAADGSTAIFGDGGSLKSYLALALGASLNSGREIIKGMPPAVTRRVGFLDWEWSPHVHRRRLERLCGDDLPDLVYVGCKLPIRDERDRLRRVIREHQLEYLVVDSVGLAAGGEPESAEVVVQFFAAIRELGLDALLVAHVTKQDAKGSADRPFGSAYWHNSARSTWYVKASPTVGGMSAGLYHRKSNDGPLSSAFTIDVDFSTDRTRMTRGDIHAVPDLAAQLPIRVRIVEALRGGALPLHELADVLGENVEAVRIATKRDQAKPEGRRQLVTFAGPDGIYRWGLASHG